MDHCTKHRGEHMVGTSVRSPRGRKVLIPCILSYKIINWLGWLSIGGHLVYPSSIKFTLFLINEKNVSGEIIYLA